MKFEINSSKLFLTYPQCPLDKNYVYEYLAETFKPTEILVASEQHKNGDLHLHCYMALDHAYRTKDPKFADLPGNYHGNYQGCRSPKNVIQYCSKDENYLANFDVSRLLDKKNSRKGDMLSLINKKRSLTELVGEQPQYLYGYTKLKLDFLNYLKDTAPPKADLPPFLPNPWGKVLSTKIKGKCRHFWIYSTRPNLGKTFKFAKPISNEYNSYIRTGSEPYWNVSGGEQLIIFDEYNHANLRYDQLNCVCDGTYQYRLFQCGTIRLVDPLIIVLSNKSIRDLYINMYELLYARFKEIKLD